MSDVPQQGPPWPPVAFKRRPHDLAKFNLLMDELQCWRLDDHADAITLHRNHIIEIIEGVKELRERLEPLRMDTLR